MKRILASLAAMAMSAGAPLMDWWRPHRAGKPSGKRYRASVRQHQRHAAKARNKAAHRRAGR